MREIRVSIFLTLASLFVLAFWGACSKARVVGSGDGDSAPEVSKEVRILESDGQWMLDSLRDGDTILFHASVDSGKFYTISWDDANGGSGFYNAWIAVLAKDSASDTEYWMGFKELGYQGKMIRAVGSVLILQVASQEMKNPENLIQTFAMKLELAQQFSSSQEKSSGQGSSGYSNYSNPWSSTSSSRLGSCSSTGSSSSSSLVSSDSWGNGGRLNPSSDWTYMHLKLGDTLTFVAPVNVGSSYSLQWMDGYDYLNSEIRNEEYPTADVEVSLNVNGKALLTNKGDGTIPYVFKPDSNRAVIRVQPNYSKLDTGWFYIRLLGSEKRRKSLEISSDWLLDSIPKANDTIQYEIDVEPNAQYRVEFIDRFYHPSYATTAISWFFKYPLDSTHEVTDLFVYAEGKLHNPAILSVPSTKLKLVVTSANAGTFQIRVQKMASTYSRVIQEGKKWALEFIRSNDTLIFKMPVVVSQVYRIQLDDSWGSGGFNYPDGFSYRNSTLEQWRTDFIGNSELSSQIVNSYSSRVLVNAQPDTLYVRVLGPNSGLIYQFYQTLALRITEAPPIKHVLLPVSDRLAEFSQEVGDTTIYHVPVTTSKPYQIQWDDASQGSGMYGSDIKVWIKDGVSASWVGFLQNGYTTMNKIAPSSDSLFVKVTGTTGMYRFGVLEYYPQNLSLTVGDAWQKDSIRQQDTIWYTVKNLTIGETYRVNFKDQYDSTRLANVLVRVYGADGVTAYSHTWGEYGYTLNTFVASESTVKIRVVGSTSALSGPFWIRFEHRTPGIPKVKQISKDWIIDTIQTYDTLCYNFPVKIGSQYRVQMHPSYSGTYVSVNNGSFSTEPLSSDLVVFSTNDTIKIKIANTYSYRSILSLIRVFEVIPANLNWSPSFAIWDDSQYLDAYGTVAFRVSGLTVGQYYTLSWDDGVSGSGQYTALARVTARRGNAGELLLSPSTSGYLSGRSLYAYESVMYIYVTSTGSNGTFAISLRSN